MSENNSSEEIIDKEHIKHQEGIGKLRRWKNDYLGRKRECRGRTGIKGGISDQCNRQGFEDVRGEEGFSAAFT